MQGNGEALHGVDPLPVIPENYKVIPVPIPEQRLPLNS